MNRDSRSTYRLFLLPMAVLLGFLLIPPAIYIIYLSFFSWGGSAVTPPLFVGLNNYVKMIGDDRFWLGLLRTFYYSGTAVFLSVIIGYCFALILNRKILGVKLFRSLVLLPMVSTPVAVAVTWVIMYNPLSGVFNWFLSLVGVAPQPWLSAKASVIPSIVIVDSWMGAPLVTVIMLAAFQALSDEPIEAAHIDGASAWQRFRYIIFPMLKPYLISATTLRVIDSMKNFDLIYVMTGGGPGRASETLNLYTFLNGFFYFEFGYSSVLAITLFLVIMGLSRILATWRERQWQY